MSPAPNRKAFIRTRVPSTERALSVAILVLLVSIGLAVWIKGHRYDAGLYALRLESLKTTTAPVEGKSGTVRASDTRPDEATLPLARKPALSSEGVSDEGGSEEVPATAPAKSEPIETKVTGLQPMSATEFYNANNLFEKIDGRAPAYLEFKFQQLRSRSFSLVGAAGSFVDVFEYRFDTPINAFGMFGLERDPKGQPLDFAPDGYAGELGFYFRQGACYIQVIASNQKSKTIELAKALARERAAAVPVDDAGLDARRRLPALGLLSDTVSFAQDNAQGQAFLKNVFQATYDFQGAKLSFFLMVAPARETGDAWKHYLDFCGKFGGKTKPINDIAGAKVFEAENFGNWKVIYQRENEIGGIIDAEDEAKAREWVQQYLEGRLK